jgi:hypothetical protein
MTLLIACRRTYEDDFANPEPVKRRTYSPAGKLASFTDVRREG